VDVSSGLTVQQQEVFDGQFAARATSSGAATYAYEADRMTAVELIDARVIARTAVFIRPGNLPHADGLLTGLGCEVNAAGFVTVDATARTSRLAEAGFRTPLRRSPRRQLPAPDTATACRLKGGYWSVSRPA
jgi:hypothetical protein